MYYVFCPLQNIISYLFIFTFFVVIVMHKIVLLCSKCFNVYGCVLEHHGNCFYMPSLLKINK